jgi:hypothetical protein
LMWCWCPQAFAATRWVVDRFPIRTVPPPRQTGCQVAANCADTVANTPPVGRFRLVARDVLNARPITRVN